jgi:uncharacterized protein YndB with AHSA1/START domain
VTREIQLLRLCSLTQRAVVVWDSSPFGSIFLASSFFCSRIFSSPAHTPLTQTVSLAQKVKLEMKIFETQREFAISPEEVFAAFEQETLLSKWWGPDGFTNTFEIFEFRSGGTWKFVMHGPDGTDYPNESKFLEISRHSKIVIRHISEPKFTLTANILKTKSGSIVEWLQEFDSEEVAQAVAHIVKPANEQNLDRLAAVLAG